MMEMLQQFISEERLKKSFIVIFFSAFPGGVMDVATNQCWKIPRSFPAN